MIIKNYFAFLFFCGIMFFEANAYDFSAKSLSGHILYYRITNEYTAEVAVANRNINERTELSGSIIIPSEVSYGGTIYKVTSLDDWAFLGGEKITSIIIPNGVKKIGTSCFLYCKSITQIQLPSSLFEIEPWAFGECKSLEEIIVPNNVEKIGVNAFNNVRNVVYNGPAKGNPWGAISILRESRKLPTISYEPIVVESTSPWSGTGWALGNGYLVTNNHVVEGASVITVKGVAGNLNNSYIAEVVATDKVNDIAILKINDKRFKGFGTLPYGVSFRIADVGEDVFVLGWPLGQILGEEIKLTTGPINSRSGSGDFQNCYQIQAPITYGNSGGPMFDSKGNVIGIVVGGFDKELDLAENVGYAIKTSYLKILIENAGLEITFPKNNTISTLSRPEKVKRVKKFVYYIECSK